VFAKEFKSFLGDPLGSQVNLLGEEQEEPPGHGLLTQEVLEIVEESGGQEAQNHSVMKNS